MDNNETSGNQLKTQYLRITETQWHAPEKQLMDKEAVKICTKLLVYKGAQEQNPGCWVV